jgi:hypothetical protein
VAAPAKAAAAPTTTATAAPTKTLASVYDQYLGRAPDAAGAQYWNQQLASGSSLADVERAIAASSEASNRSALANVYDQYLGRAPDVEGAQYWNEQLSGGSSIADVERAIAASSEATNRSILAAAPTSNIVNTQTFDPAIRDEQFDQPMKVSAAMVSNILQDQLGLQAVGQRVPVEVMSNGQIKYRFEGDLGLPNLADVYGIFASLPDTVNSYGELSDRIAYLRANPQEQLTSAPTDPERGYYGSLALAMDASPTGELTREQMKEIADPYYAVVGGTGGQEKFMKDLIYLQPGINPYTQVANSAAAQLQQLNNTSMQPVNYGTTAGTTSGYNPARITGAQTVEVPSYGSFTPTQIGYGTTPGAYRPVTPLPFGDVLSQTMQPATTPFTMPRQQPVFGGPVNVPSTNPFDTTYTQPETFVYPAQTQLPPMQYANPFEPAMFAEGGEVNQPGFMEVGTPGFMSQAMSGQMPTYQYPAYGGMPQDVFDWTAPRVSNGQLIQPTRQAPAQFEAPIYTAPQPVYGGTPPYGTPSYGTPSTGGGMSAPTPIPPTTTPSILDPVITTTPYTGGRTPVVREKTPYVQQADPNAAVRDQITGIYSTVLNRMPDPTGLDYWTVMANQGMSMDDIRRNIQLNENQQIAQAYKDILGRDEVDPEGLAYWANSGQDLDTIRRNIQFAKEQQGIAALPVAQGTTTPVEEVTAPSSQFVSTNYESGEGYYLNPNYSNSWYAGDSGGDVGANTGPGEAAAAAADAAAAAEGASGQGEGTGAEGPGTE